MRRARAEALDSIFMAQHHIWTPNRSPDSISARICCDEPLFQSKHKRMRWGPYCSRSQAGQLFATVTRTVKTAYFTSFYKTSPPQSRVVGIIHRVNQTSASVGQPHPEAWHGYHRTTIRSHPARQFNRAESVLRGTQLRQTIGLQMLVQFR